MKLLIDTIMFDENVFRIHIFIKLSYLTVDTKYRPVGC